MRPDYKQSISDTSELYEDLLKCRNCGSTWFKIYVTCIIDGARLYCAECGEPV